MTLDDLYIELERRLLEFRGPNVLASHSVDAADDALASLRLSYSLYLRTRELRGNKNHCRKCGVLLERGIACNGCAPSETMRKGGFGTMKDSTFLSGIKALVEAISFHAFVVAQASGNQSAFPRPGVSDVITELDTKVGEFLELEKRQ